jgi:hypothetical protein
MLSQCKLDKRRFLRTKLFYLQLLRKFYITLHSSVGIKYGRFFLRFKFPLAFYHLKPKAGVQVEAKLDCAIEGKEKEKKKEIK